MTTAQAARHHLLKMGLCNNVYSQANHGINPSSRAIAYMRDQWLKRKHDGHDNIPMLDAVNKYARDNPEVTLLTDTINGQFCIVLVTPFMRRVHMELQEAGEIVYVDAIGCVDKQKTVVVPLLCAGPVGAVPLAILFTSSKDEATLKKGRIIPLGVDFLIGIILMTMNQWTSK